MKSFELYNDKEAFRWANEISKIATGTGLEPTPMDKTEVFASAVAESKDTGKAMGEAVLGAIPLPGTKFLGRTVGGIVGGVVGGSVKGISEIIKSGKQQEVTVEANSQTFSHEHEPLSTSDSAAAEKANSLNSNKKPNRCHSCGAPIAVSAAHPIYCQYCDTKLH